MADIYLTLARKLFLLQILNSFALHLFTAQRQAYFQTNAHEVQTPGKGASSFSYSFPLSGDAYTFIICFYQIYTFVSFFLICLLPSPTFFLHQFHMLLVLKTLCLFIYFELDSW